MLLLCIIFAMNPELADGTLSGKICWFHFTSLLLAGGVLLMEFTTKTKSRFIFSLPECPIITSVRYRIGFLSDKDEKIFSRQRFLFHRSAGLLLVYAQRLLYRRIRNYDRFSLRSSYLPESFRPSGGSAIPSILLPSPILSSGCLKHRWNQSLSMAISQSFFQSVWTHYSVLRIATRSLCGKYGISTKRSCRNS